MILYSEKNPVKKRGYITVINSHIAPSDVTEIFLASKEEQQQLSVAVLLSPGIVCCEVSCNNYRKQFRIITRGYPERGVRVWIRIRYASEPSLIRIRFTF